MTRGAASMIALATALSAMAGRAADYVDLPGGTFASAVAGDPSQGLASVAPFAMRTLPVTRGEFQRFVSAHPAWRPDSVARVFADSAYLADWTPASPPDDDDRRPVTRVSWFAAQAYCESEGARLPTWNEWEFAAAADATRPDARPDPAWRARILDWYAHPAGARLAPVGGAANYYGVRDLHGLVWEWVDDFDALFVDADGRSAVAGRLAFCGAGAVDLRLRDNYAVLMRVALLSSLEATDSTASLGFRCARSIPRESP